MNEQERIAIREIVRQALVDGWHVGWAGEKMESIVEIAELIAYNIQKILEKKPAEAVEETAVGNSAVGTLCVRKYHRMNPERDDVVLGCDLVSGMVVLIEDPDSRMELGLDVVLAESESRDDKILTRNRWCRVESCRSNREYVTFVGVYADKTKHTRHYPIEDGWIVAKETMPLCQHGSAHCGVCKPYEYNYQKPPKKLPPFNTGLGGTKSSTVPPEEDSSRPTVPLQPYYKNWEKPWYSDAIGEAPVEAEAKDDKPSYKKNAWRDQKDGD